MIEELINECKNRNLHVSVTYQRITDISIEIYKGYKSNYQCLFYIDGKPNLESAIIEATEWLNTINNSTSNPY